MPKEKTSYLTVIFFIVLFMLTTFNSALAESSLHGATWKWFYLEEKKPALQSVVPKPDNYTLIFSENNTLQIKADCNMVQGSYTVEDTELSITLGPSTMAACGEQSLDIMYLDLLSRVGFYTLDKDKLILHLQDGKGEMTFKE